MQSSSETILSRYWKKARSVKTGVNSNNFFEIFFLFYREIGLWRDSKWTAKVWLKYCPACLIYLLWEWWLESLLSLKRHGKWVVLGHCSHLSGECSAPLTLLKERWGTPILLSVFLVLGNVHTIYFEAGDPPSEEEFWWGGFWGDKIVISLITQLMCLLTSWSSLYCIFFSSLSGLAGSCSEVIWLYEIDTRFPIFAAELVLFWSGQEERSPKLLSFCSVINVLVWNCSSNLQFFKKRTLMLQKQL